MKKLVLLAILCILVFAVTRADFLGIYNDNGADSVWVYISMWDSLDMKFEKPDTLFIYRYAPSGDTITSDAITSPSAYNFATGFYMKKYAAGTTAGQYVVHAYASGNGHYYSLANHCYYVNSLGLNELTSATIGTIADSTRELVWKTDLSPGYPSSGDTASAMMIGILAGVDGNGLGGIDADIAALADIDTLDVYRTVLSVLRADSATVDTGDGSFAHAAVRISVIPDSLLKTATKIDSLYAYVGNPYSSTEIPTLHMKIGLGYDGSAGTGNIKDQLDTVRIYVGKPGLSMNGRVSLHDKLGDYDGAAGLGNIKNQLDTVRIYVGEPGVSMNGRVSLHDKLGDYDGAAGLGNIKNQLDTVRIYVGEPGVSLDGRVSLHDKLGDYAGMAGIGNNIKDDLQAANASGGGSEPETLIVMSVGDSTLIEGAKINLKTIDGSTVIVAGLTTDVRGQLILSLDADSFQVEISAYSFNPIFDTLVVDSGGDTDRFYLNRFDPGNPISPELCRVYGWVYDISGDSLDDVEITVEIPRQYHPVKYGEAIITPFACSTTTDSTGYWRLDLIPSELLDNDEVEYLFTIKNSNGVIYKANAQVPQFSSWRFQ